MPTMPCSRWRTGPGSNQEQSLYFEAMRDLRLRRKSIERSFLQQYFERFAALNNVVGSKPEMRLDSVSYEDLSLVQNDALEESVAVDTMVAKALSNNAMAISHLTIRFNTQLSSKVDDATHPLGPRRLCEAFVEACRDLDTDIKVKLIIYKLFERFVLNGLGQLYAESNRQLVDAGVLPQLKAIPQQVPGRTAKGYSGRTPAHVNAEDDGQELFGTLQGLLAQLRNPAAVGGVGAGSGGEAASTGDSQAITSYDLMRLLSHLQQQISGQPLDGYDLKQQLGIALGRISERSGRQRVVGQVDEDVINLVAMLFEFILDDLTLPDSLKALIARLQIPMLKVAVLDKTFFSRGSHPARRLLNEIAAASLGWGEQSDLQRDGLYQKIEQIVQRLLTDFVDDPEIFAELLADFMAYVGDEQRRSELLEQRTRDAEEGRARAEIARLQVEHVLSQRLQGHQLPAAVQRVLREAWSQVLLLTCLKQGYDSSEWRAALQTMDDLIWSIQPHYDVASRQRLLEEWCPACSRPCAKAWRAPPSIRSPPPNSSPSSNRSTCRPSSRPVPSRWIRPLWMPSWPRPRRSSPTSLSSCRALVIGSPACSRIRWSGWMACPWAPGLRSWISNRSCAASWRRSSGPWDGWCLSIVPV
ncbi:hypothetical protein Q3H58_001855 [Pseudomonas psychrotolerans]|nr:hypothetical protein [Pseudomonas psychrotolerans]